MGACKLLLNNNNIDQTLLKICFQKLAFQTNPVQKSLDDRIKKILLHCDTMIEPGFGSGWSFTVVLGSMNQM